MLLTDYLFFIQVHVSHIYREGNCVAIRLSTMGIDYRHIKWWDSHSFECNELIPRSSEYTHVKDVPFFRIKRCAFM